MSETKNEGRYSLETFTIDETAPIMNDVNSGTGTANKVERGVMSVLTINRVDNADENVYKCSMTNPFGSDSAFIQLVVQGILYYNRHYKIRYNIFNTVLPMLY